MLTRTAVFVGRIHDGQEDAFFELLLKRLFPIWQRMPNVLDVRLLKPLEKDNAAPELLFMQQIDYPNRAAIDEALASPVRDEAVAAVEDLYTLFEGHHYHYIFEKLTD